MEEKDMDFFKKFDNGERMFSKVFREAKKEIILQDQEEFVESMAEKMQEDYGLTEDDAERYSSLIYEIWEDKCGCSVTSFDQEISALKKRIFA